MIPKKIHYIWLGGNPLPELVKKCIESWEKYCPDFEIVQWNENNLNIDINNYCRQAYDAKKWAFASDALRFQVLKEHGGIYLDVDVELLKPLDDLLNHNVFFGFEMGEELVVNPGLIMGAEPNSKVIMELAEIYKKENFILKNGKFNYETICTKTTKYLIENYGLKIENLTQRLGNITVYATEFFCPINSQTKKELVTKNTYSKHLYLGSWVPKVGFITKIKNCFKSCLRKIIGKRNYEKLKKKLRG